MNKSRLLGAVCACLAFYSFNASAALIDNGTYITDTDTGLDWLDLAETTGQSSINALFNNPDYRHATISEVADVFAKLFPNYSGNHYGQDFRLNVNTADIVNFISLFGLTSSYSESNGIVKDDSSDWKYVGAYRTTNDSINRVYGPAGTLNYNHIAAGGFGYGYYMVHETSTVPLPPAVWLFGSGLLGLVGMARRRKAA